MEAEEPQDLNDKDDGMAHSTLDEDEELFDFDERYMTDEDNRIIQIDIPERMQVLQFFLIRLDIIVSNCIGLK